MNRSDLIVALINAHPDLTAEHARLTVDTFFGRVAEQIVSGGRVEFRGFGTFATMERPPRIGRNPYNGNAVEVPAKRVLLFSASKLLKKRLTNRVSERRAGLSHSAK